jgi:hypothetical protein
MAHDEQTEIFENTTTGFLGAIKIDRRGDRRSVSIAPGERVELTKEEQEVTAEAHRDPKGNPFVEQDFEVRDMNTGELKESGRRPPLQLVTERRPIGSDQEEVGAPPAPAGDAAEGSFAPGEEVGDDGRLKTAADIKVGTESG